MVLKLLTCASSAPTCPPKTSGPFSEGCGAERERQAKQYRSEGVEEATKLRSEADRERAVILAEANRRSSVIRGEGDATAARVFAEAFSRAPDFYKFQRGLEALKKGFEQIPHCDYER